MYRVLSFFLSTIFFCGQLSAQRMFTLQQCLDSATANYIPVKRSSLSVQAAQVNLNQSRANLLPNLAAYLEHGVYFGRSVDPTSNAYVDQQFNYANYQLGSN